MVFFFWEEKEVKWPKLSELRGQICMYFSSQNVLSTVFSMRRASVLCSLKWDDALTCYRLLQTEYVSMSQAF